MNYLKTCRPCCSTTEHEALHGMSLFQLRKRMGVGTPGLAPLESSPHRTPRGGETVVGVGVRGKKKKNITMIPIFHSLHSINWWLSDEHQTLMCQWHFWDANPGPKNLDTTAACCSDPRKATQGTGSSLKGWLNKLPVGKLAGFVKADSSWKELS